VQTWNGVSSHILRCCAIYSSNRHHNSPEISSQQLLFSHVRLRDGMNCTTSKTCAKNNSTSVSIEDAYSTESNLSHRKEVSSEVEDMSVSSQAPSQNSSMTQLRLKPQMSHSLRQVFL